MNGAASRNNVAAKSIAQLDLSEIVQDPFMRGV